MWPPGSADTICPRPPLNVTFDRLSLKFELETDMRVASKVGNLPSKWAHNMPSVSRFIRYLRDGHRRTDKSNAYCPLLYGRGHKKQICRKHFCCYTISLRFTCKRISTPKGKPMSCDLPDGEAHDDHLLLGVVLAVMVTPFRCPEAINADGDESVD